MADLQKVIKLTQAQYDTLAAGGTVGSYTGLDANYLYLVPGSSGVPYTTTAPTAANTDGGLRFVVLSSEPATKYAGYVYFITEA